ncbi:MAG: DUF6164 family protein [Mariprofundus sp.]|nr:DUF6164 family protein [Mariprofundus sp.]
MAAKLFKLRNVPDDEAEDIRQLLQEHGIEYYETEAGGWGISVPAIWIHDNSRLEEAGALIDIYQQERTRRAKIEYRLLKDEGRHPKVTDKIRQKPLQFLLFFLMTLFILYVSLAPFINFSE